MSDEIGRPPADDEVVRNGFEAVTEDVLPVLIARLRASRLGEIEVSTDAWRVRLRRDMSRAQDVASTGTASPEAPAAEPLGSVARSTAVGYFSPSSALVIGHTVQAGDLLGTIDVLGITQEVTAPDDGVISRILAEDGQAVEYGQALADIDPLGIDLEADELGEADELAGTDGDDTARLPGIPGGSDDAGEAPTS